MQSVRIHRVAVTHPDHWVTQGEAVTRLVSLGADPRRVSAVARGTQIEKRALALAAQELESLGGTEARNEVFRQITPVLARRVADHVLGEAPRADVACLVTSSCTGYTAPSWAVGLAEHCGFPTTTMRLPITEAGCAGGVVALARAADYLQAHGGVAALAVAVELCSLAFHPGGDEGNLTSTLIFGDGAGAALLRTGPGPGLAIVDSITELVPDSQQALGFDLTDHGFYPRLARELVDLLPGPTVRAATRLLQRNSLQRSDITAWLLHPGGARILRVLQDALGATPDQTRWSWASMRAYGNTSSAAIFDVLRRYLEDASADQHAVVVAFGPGVSIELMLVRASC